MVAAKSPVVGRWSILVRTHGRTHQKSLAASQLGLLRIKYPILQDLDAGRATFYYVCMCICVFIYFFANVTKSTLWVTRSFDNGITRWQSVNEFNDNACGGNHDYYY